MKTCNKCGETKEFSEFRKRKTIKDGHCGHCKACEPKNKYKEYQAQWYANKKATDPEWVKKRNENNKQWYTSRKGTGKAKEYSRTQRGKRQAVSNSLKFPCIVCGENDPVVLDWHHLDPSNKTDGVAHMIAKMRPIEIIKEEISKCTCLCANCHRRHHAGTIDIEPYLINHRQT